MIHATDFVSAARRRALPRIPDDVPLTPAAYLRLRREFAGISRQHVAAQLALVLAPRTDDTDARAARAFGSRDDALALVDQLETPGARARHREAIEVLQAIFPLDPDVYFQLADTPAHRHPRVCRGCGCSTYDTCNGHDGVCTWATPSQCTRCAEREAR